uniref:SLC26A/SulP transporter domain-containing protein n=1 Tax=Panagrolaimus superbus TaxID=310955 RepID=A0A914YEU2_9BILA
MHVPQGMAYATFGRCGTNLWIIFVILRFINLHVFWYIKTYKYWNILLFASMMVGSVRFRLIPESIDSVNVHSAADGILGSNVTTAINHPLINNNYEVMTLLSTLTFGVGIVQLLMGIFRLSFLTTYMSDALIAGYTTATAAHVLISQLNKVIGVKLPRYNGNGMLFFMLRDIIMAIPNANIMAVAISTFGLAFLYIGKEYINPFVKKRSPLPIPFELLLVIFGILFSTFFKC